MNESWIQAAAIFVVVIGTLFLLKKSVNLFYDDRFKSFHLSLFHKYPVVLLTTMRMKYFAKYDK